MQDILVHLIVAGAVLFMIRWVYRNMASGKKQQPGCSSCERCAPEPQEQQHAAHDAAPAHSSPVPPKG